jgi:hypothetical protein
MRLVAIGFAYSGVEGRSHRQRLQVPGAVSNLAGTAVSDSSEGVREQAGYRRYNPSIVPRHFELPQWQAYFFFDSSVMGSSISSA